MPVNKSDLMLFIYVLLHVYENPEFNFPAYKRVEKLMLLKRE